MSFFTSFLEIISPRSNWSSRFERNRYNTIIHRSNAKIFAVDNASNIILWNDGMADIMGIASDEVIARQINEVFPDESSAEDEASEADGGLVSWMSLAATQGMVMHHKSSNALKS